MKNVERLALVLLDDQLEPIDQCVVHAFACAEARNSDSVRGESPLFGGGQVEGRSEDACFMSNGGK